MSSSQSQMSIIDAPLETASKVAKLCFAVLIICSLPIFIGAAVYGLIRSDVLQTACTKMEHTCGFFGAKTTDAEIQNSAKTVVARVDGNHGELLNSLSEKFQFVVDANKNSSSEILAAILAQHNQTRHEHRVATDALALMQQQLLNVTLAQMIAVAQECPVKVLATIYPRLDAIDATLRANLDKETALKNARKEIKKLKGDLKAARDAEAALDTQLNDPWTSLVVMLALALCVADDKDMSNTLCVTVFWIGYKIAYRFGVMWPLTPLCAVLVPISGVLLMLVSKFGSKRARERDAKSSADSSAPVVATSAATIDPAAQAVLNSSLQRKFIKQQNYRRFVEDESRMPPPPSYVTGDE